VPKIVASKIQRDPIVPYPSRHLNAPTHHRRDIEDAAPISKHASGIGCRGLIWTTKAARETSNRSEVDVAGMQESLGMSRPSKTRLISSTEIVSGVGREAPLRRASRPRANRRPHQSHNRTSANSPEFRGPPWLPRRISMSSSSVIM